MTSHDLPRSPTRSPQAFDRDLPQPPTISHDLTRSHTISHELTTISHEIHPISHDLPRAPTSSHELAGLDSAGTAAAALADMLRDANGKGEIFHRAQACISPALARSPIISPGLAWPRPLSNNLP